MWHGYGWGMNWGMMLVGGLLMLLFWGGIIALTFFAIRALVRPGQSQDGRPLQAQPGENALEVLKKRYARGEISREEYLEIRRDLES